MKSIAAMKAMPLTSRPATPDDIPWIMAVEQDPAFSPYIVSWERERHERALADPRFLYRIAATPEQSRIGFAILIQNEPSPGQVYLQRLAIFTPGQGLGRRFLNLILQELFVHHHRLWLNIFPDNRRGRDFYQALGLVVIPGATNPLFHHGHWRDALVMEILSSP